MEKNHHILEEALRQLKSYSPEVKVWDSLDQKLSETVLRKSLSKLKTIDPPDMIWESIVVELSGKEKLDQLHNFEPPENIWANIEAKLDGRSNKKTNIRLLKWKVWTAAAIVISVFTYFLIRPVPHDTTIIYSQEIIESENFDAWSDDHDIVQALNQLCAAHPMACASPGFKAREKELNDLDVQKKEILNRMSAFGNNKNLQLMLTKIELEKNEIIRQMISEIM